MLAGIWRTHCCCDFALAADKKKKSPEASVDGSLFCEMNFQEFFLIFWNRNNINISLKTSNQYENLCCFFFHSTHSIHSTHKKLNTEHSNIFANTSSKLWTIHEILKNHNIWWRANDLLHKVQIDTDLCLYIYSLKFNALAFLVDYLLKSFHMWKRKYVSLRKK